MITNLFWVLLLSMSPIAELRGAIPLGVLIFHINPVLIFFIAVLGNFLVVPLLLIFLKYFSEFLMHRFYFFNRLLSYIFARTRAHHQHKFEKWEHWALLALVAIPIPFTGAWTGALAAFLFDIPFKRSMWMIFGGIVIAALIVTALMLLGNGVANGII